jgi:hypothetical protein
MLGIRYLVLICQKGYALIVSISIQKHTGDIPKKIFENFLNELQKKGISSDIIKRLRDNYETGIDKEVEIKNLLLPEDSK